MSALDYLGGVTANTRAKATAALAFLESKGYHPTHFWGYDPNASNTEHHARVAVDFMVFGNTWAGDELAAWMWANRARFGVKHIIWKQRILSTVVSPGVWRAMADRGSPTNNHMDHVHVMFFDTPIKANPPASSVPSLPKGGTIPRALVVDGDRGPATYKLLQAYLNYALGGADIPVDGDFGPKTVRAIERWVKGKVDGSMSADDVRRFQRKVGAYPDGAWGPKTTRALQVWLNNHRTLVRY